MDMPLDGLPLGRDSVAREIRRVAPAVGRPLHVDPKSSHSRGYAHDLRQRSAAPERQLERRVSLQAMSKRAGTTVPR